jgi:hypothetical protein
MPTATERIIHDASAISRAEGRILMKELFNARLVAIQSMQEDPDRNGDWPGRPSRGRRALPGKPRPAGGRGRARLPRLQFAESTERGRDDEEAYDEDPEAD